MIVTNIIEEAREIVDMEVEEEVPIEPLQTKPTNVEIVKKTQAPCAPLVPR